jgi:hypothetical protein
MEVQANAVKRRRPKSGELNPPKPFTDGGGVRTSARVATRFCNSFDRMAIQG